MTFIVEKCNDEDMFRAFELMSLAFGHEHPYIEYAFPEHDTPAGRKIGGQRLLAMKDSDPHTTCLKIVDTKSQQMIAFGKWNAYRNMVPPEVQLDGDFWKSNEEKEYAQHLFHEYLIPRRQAIIASEGNIVCK
jgi:hypothetical protein